MSLENNPTPSQLVKAVKNIETSKLNVTGGDITGNLNIKSDTTTKISLTTDGDVSGRYLKGTWLQTTSATELNSPSKIAVLDGNGWIYYRSLTNLKSDLNIPTVNNNTITLQQNGIIKGSFTLNQNVDQTVNLDSSGSDISSTQVQITEVD